MRIGQKVRPNTSAKAGEVGVIVGFEKNPLLPITVLFDDIEWDFKESELEVVR